MANANIGKRLMRAAREAQVHAYSPYSSVKVGAALLASDGTVFLGANIENASYGMSVCAERVAAVCALMAGIADWRGLAIALSGASPSPPCGACCQFLAEFAPSDMVVFWGGDGRSFKSATLCELLPLRFQFKKSSASSRRR